MLFVDPCTIRRYSILSRPLIQSRRLDLTIPVRYDFSPERLLSMYQKHENYIQSVAGRTTPITKPVVYLGLECKSHSPSTSHARPRSSPSRSHCACLVQTGLRRNRESRMDSRCQGVYSSLSSCHCSGSAVVPVTLIPKTQFWHHRLTLRYYGRPVCYRD